MNKKWIILILLCVSFFAIGSVGAANLENYDFDGYFTMNVPGDVSFEKEINDTSENGFDMVNAAYMSENIVIFYMDSPTLSDNSSVFIYQRMFEQLNPGSDKCYESQEGNLTILESTSGGGALFFHALSNYEVTKSYISDTNEDLILTYKVIQKHPEDLIDELNSIKSKFDDGDYEGRKECYYKIRKEFNKLKDKLNYKKYSKEHIPQAAYLIFLNKTCFNGIYRVNSKGYFNVPMGRYKNPSIFDEKNIYAISDKIQNTTIKNDSYECYKNLIDEKSLVYFDPPYRPITETSFTNYTKSSFNDDDQKKLAKFYRDIDNKHNHNVKLILSNSDPHIRDENDNFFDIELYEGFNIKRIPARRYVNRNGDGRGPIKEILVRNYKNKKDLID
ncbi:DNA adenine methylase [Methanobrevibacter sp.]|uniref:DNA adenine methylase n=1 Tax=Methanobrevibacter sp. TaxID=66852 RepID=UPI00388E799C